MRISIIAAVDQKRGIGKNNGLLLSIPEDMQRFRTVTHGHPVIMGRRTFESKEIKGKLLPGRYNIVITRDLGFKIKDLREENGSIAGSLDEALRQAQGKPGSDEVFVIGGGQIYHQAISIADRLYLTLLGTDFEADTFFPDYSDFKKVIFEEEHQWGKYKYKFLTLEK